MTQPKDMGAVADLSRGAPTTGGELAALLSRTHRFPARAALTQVRALRWRDIDSAHAIVRVGHGVGGCDASPCAVLRDRPATGGADERAPLRSPARCPSEEIGGAA